MLQDHILRDTDISGMESDYENALDDLRGTILNHKASTFFVKLFKIWTLSLT